MDPFDRLNSQNHRTTLISYYALPRILLFARTDIPRIPFQVNWGACVCSVWRSFERPERRKNDDHKDSHQSAALSTQNSCSFYYFPFALLPLLQRSVWWSEETPSWCALTTIASRVYMSAEQGEIRHIECSLKLNTKQKLHSIRFHSHPTPTRDAAVLVQAKRRDIYKFGSGERTENQKAYSLPNAKTSPSASTAENFIIFRFR